MLQYNLLEMNDTTTDDKNREMIWRLIEQKNKITDRFVLCIGAIGMIAGFYEYTILPQTKNFEFEIQTFFGLVLTIALCGIATGYIDIRKLKK